MNLVSDNVTATILAGGKGQRFEGRDKGLVEFKQRPIIEHVIDIIEPQVGKIMINANRNADTYAAYGYPVISDVLNDYQGPLAGFATAMQYAQTPYVLILPCDGPLISNDFVERMASAMAAEKTHLAVAHDGARLQPVHALLSVQLLGSLRRFLESGDRKIDRWYGLHRISRVDFSDSPEIFQNINTWEELQTLEKQKHD